MANSTNMTPNMLCPECKQPISTQHVAAGEAINTFAKGSSVPNGAMHTKCLTNKMSNSSSNNSSSSGQSGAAY
jgi:hypothetical protein